jgi:AraC-like DNA-binding protein
MITVMLLAANAQLRTASPAMTTLVAAGSLKQAVAKGLGSFDRHKRHAFVEGDVLMARVTTRSLLALGREEEAEELMRQMLKMYEALPRKGIRCNAAIDRATFMLHLNKPAHAAQMLTELADDTDAPSVARMEILLLLGSAYLSMGRHTDAFQSLELARNLANDADVAELPKLVEMAQLQLEISVWLRSLAELADHFHCSANDSVLKHLRPVAEIDAQLTALSRRTDLPCLGSQHAARLHGWLRAGWGMTNGTQELLGEVARTEASELVGVAARFRVTAALACLGANSISAASQLLNTLIFDERKLIGHRFARELHYCASKLHAHHGRHSDALRLYKQYTTNVLENVRAGATTIRVPRCLTVNAKTYVVDSTEGRLPPRYRRAYRYLIEHLDQPELSVRQVAAQIDVTERSLQLAFHKHLGMTPAEVIRNCRMKGIHDDLTEGASTEGVLTIAMRWGVTNRSTLAQSYRASYGKTPSQARRTLGDNKTLQ